MNFIGDDKGRCATIRGASDFPYDRNGMRKTSLHQDLRQSGPARRIIHDDNLARMSAGDIFDTAPVPEEIAGSPASAPCPYTWSAAVAKSGVEERRVALIAAPEPRS